MLPPDSPVSLTLLPGTLAVAMLRCNVVQLRRGAVKAARMALVWAALGDPRVDVALAALESGRTGEGPAREAIGRLCEELDTAAWASRDRGDAALYGRTSRQARAANALWSALDRDPVVAAADAAYEAHAALDDWEPLIELWR
jgi:hypothetical protein